MSLWQIIGALTGRCRAGHAWGPWSRYRGARIHWCARCGASEETVNLSRARAAGVKRKARAKR